MDAKLNRRQFLRAMAIVGESTLIAAVAHKPPANRRPPPPPPQPQKHPATTIAPTVVMEPTKTSTIDITYWGSFSGGLGEAEELWLTASMRHKAMSKSITNSKATTKKLPKS
jgi:sn-glycerol 3-phosphate transport system substrate-binding protein